MSCQLIAGYDYIGVGVGAMLFNNKGEVFLAQRGEKARNERGFWEFPGGEVTFGEKLTNAIHREFLEEYGIEIEVLELLSVADHLLNQENQHWVSVTFIARHISGNSKILESEKCSDIGWFLLSSLPEPLSSISKKNLYSYREKYGQRAFY
ncbi:MAG: NUDIX domain-containing protein [Nostoc sp. S4]|nr:NUDIX domain-containing protein [Nostoc sp. S4]